MKAFAWILTASVLLVGADVLFMSRDASAATTIHASVPPPANDQVVLYGGSGMPPPPPDAF